MARNSLKKRIITCKRIDKMIPDYLNNNLSNSDLEKFIAHIDSCQDCKEELAVQFLITEGLNTLSDGESFDLQKEFEERMNKSHRYIHLFKKLLVMRNIALGLVVAAIVILIYCVCIYL